MFYALRMDGRLAIRPMMGSDVDDFVREERAQGWHSEPGKLLSRLEHERAGKCVTLTAEFEGECAGYVFVYPDSPWDCRRSSISPCSKNSAGGGSAPR